MNKETKSKEKTFPLKEWCNIFYIFSHKTSSLCIKKRKFLSFKQKTPSISLCSSKNKVHEKGLLQISLMDTSVSCARPLCVSLGSVRILLILYKQSCVQLSLLTFVIHGFGSIPQDSMADYSTLLSSGRPFPVWHKARKRKVKIKDDKKLANARKLKKLTSN